ncbi:Hypothetical predicted protein, partial [Pelobates cultripes]
DLHTDLATEYDSSKNMLATGKGEIPRAYKQWHKSEAHRAKRVANQTVMGHRD